MMTSEQAKAAAEEITHRSWNPEGEGNAEEQIAEIIQRHCGETMNERLLSVCERAQQDVNWMLNNHKFLNADVFDYLDKAIVEARAATEAK